MRAKAQLVFRLAFSVHLSLVESPCQPKTFNADFTEISNFGSNVIQETQSLSSISV